MWEIMWKLKLIWLNFQLRLENQHKIIPTERLVGVPINIDGVHNVFKYEVIDIMENNQPYLALIELDWTFDI
jgi:hypothetical protein